MFVTLTGCGSSNLIVPTTLPGLNDELDGRKARIVLTDGRVIDEVRDVYVHEDLTTYRENRGERISVATADIESIAVRVSTGRARGATIGSIPGILVTGLGTILLLTEGDRVGGLMAGGIGLVYGILGTGIGAVAGMFIGDAVTTDRYHIVYVGDGGSMGDEASTADR